ncbi:MAG: preprotein translocase subunit SecG [Rhodobacteraceae bacterium HLUCCA12]|nr:MAG: preprotein translocase subunit SecG [Rhodobacteraceae bacterium HLUCCA12]
MQNVVLIIHLLLALALIGVVLLQRSEGGGLGIGGGGMGPQAGRPPLTGLAKVTWGLAIAFICTSLALTVIAARNSADTSVLDRMGTEQAPSEEPDLPDVELPPADSDAPLLPPRED